MIALPEYNGQEKKILPLLAIPLSFVLNAIYFSKAYFSSIPFFAITTTVTFLELCLDFIICGFLALLIQKRFPNEDELIPKLGFMISTFILVSVLMKYFLFKLY